MVATEAQHLLPYPPHTLHYQECGCPAEWQPGTRACDLVDVLVQKAVQLWNSGRLVARRHLRVAYMLPHHNVTGGMKCLVEHVRLLRERGHYVIAVHRSETAARAMPPWTTVEADADVVCRLDQRLGDVYPAHAIDVVVVGIFHQVAELLVGVPAPVLYWEQGHEWLFGDPVRFQKAKGTRLPRVLLVGNPALPLKGFDAAIAVLASVNRVLPLAITWVCQVPPTAAMLPALPTSGLRIALHVNPSQEELPGLYRGHDAFLFTSRYEAWGMPVLEAMASGLAVVAARCLGVQTFACHTQNCLLADPQDVAGLARALLTVLVDAGLRSRLAAAARATALQFSPATIAHRLEGVLYGLAGAGRELLHLRAAALTELHLACVAASLACAKANPQPRSSRCGAEGDCALGNDKAGGEDGNDAAAATTADGVAAAPAAPASDDEPPHACISLPCRSPPAATAAASTGPQNVSQVASNKRPEEKVL